MCVCVCVCVNFDIDFISSKVMIMSLFSFLFCPSHHYGNPQSKKGRRKVFDLISPGVFATSFDLSVDTIPSGSSALGIEQPGLPEIHSFVSWIPIGEV